MKKFLITGFYFNGYHGSMIHICEYAKKLGELGFEVYIAAVEISREIKTFVEKTTNAKLFYFAELPLANTYDYVLAIHEPIITYLINEGLKYKYLGFCSLSHYIELEAPGFLTLQNFPLIVHSQECKDAFSGQYKLENIYVLENSVPDNYTITNLSGELKHVAIVSNHVPKELIETKSMLENSRIIVNIYGKSYNYVPLTSEILDDYDLVITIGKTVQYALYKGIPVYSYDCFGGNGYITPENIVKENYYNFSGRSSYRKINAEELFKEITSGYKTAYDNRNKLRETARKKYSLPDKVQKIIEILENDGCKKIEETPAWLIYKAHCISILNELIKARQFNERFIHYSEKSVKLYKFINRITFGLCFKNSLKNINELYQYLEANAKL